MMNKRLNKYSLLFFLFLVSFFRVQAQKANWQNLDLGADSVFGISTEKAYDELLKDKKPHTVLVAVIDGGVDTAHEDLEAVIWNNPKRNKINDTHGWNFIGSAKGNVLTDNAELTRLVREQTTKFAGLDSLTVPPQDKPAFQLWLKERRELKEKIAEAKRNFYGMQGFKNILDTIILRTGRDHPGLDDLLAYQPRNEMEKTVKNVVTAELKQYPDLAAFEKTQLEEGLKHERELLDYSLNVGFDPRPIVGDNYADSRQRNYGNNDVTGPDAHHGTHVAGIIAAVRDNNRGIKGVANAVRIISVRAVPNGDERDKDVANAIRYATDRGAKVINMSFGKDYSYDKQAVDEAVKYAARHDVLLVHAAGNENRNLDSLQNYPNRHYEDGETAQNWIEVGASGWKNDTTLKASFSNYGKTAVDVFAPGVQINSTIPGSKYAKFDGTSMAAPVVAGLAALIREYYPELSALEVKGIILRSAVKVDHMVKVSTGKDSRMVPFTELCNSGGIVNAYRALLLAANYKLNKQR